MRLGERSAPAAPLSGTLALQHTQRRQRCLADEGGFNGGEVTAAARGRRGGIDEDQAQAAVGDAAGGKIGELEKSP